LLRPGTDVLLDPGDNHGGIGSPGTVVHDDAHRANVPWRRNGCAWARRTLNSRQSAKTTPTATPRCPSMLSPLSRCPCSPGPEPVTPGSSTGSTSPSESGSTTSALRSGSSALAGPSTRVHSRTWRRPGPERQVMASQEAAELACSLVSGSGAASPIVVAGMPARRRHRRRRLITGTTRVRQVRRAARMSVPIICSGPAQAALWANSMPTMRRFTRTASDQDRQHNVTNADRRRAARSPTLSPSRSATADRPLCAEHPVQAHADTARCALRG
jgi:hypothetical protein